MKLQAKQIYNMIEAITNLSQEKLSMPTAFYVAKNTKVIKEEAAAIDEARQKLVTEFAEKKEDGNVKIDERGMVKIDDNKMIAFNEQLNNLFNAEIEIDIKKIPLNSLNSINLSVATIEKLLPIIDDSEI